MYGDDENLKKIIEKYHQKYWQYGSKSKTNREILVSKICRNIEYFLQNFGLGYIPQKIHWQFITDYLKSNKIKNVLEVGGGEESMLKFLEKKGYNVVGVESDTTICNKLKKSIKKGKCLNISVDKNIDANLKKFMKQKFDLIILSEVFYYFPRPDIVFKKLGNMLNKDGYIYLKMPNSNGLYWENYNLKHGNAVFWFNKKNFTNMIEKLKFRIVIVKEIEYEIDMQSIFSRIAQFIKYDILNIRVPERENITPEKRGKLQCLIQGST
ncbi:MAG: class I SAM-dependent methyltransferase [Thermoplasmatales archaeon]|nr:class I SAM-dependent methyltransferase [Thermoplasmatales archaeon]